MKKMLFTLVSMLTIAAAANAMSYEQARNEASMRQPTRLTSTT